MALQATIQCEREQNKRTTTRVTVLVFFFCGGWGIPRQSRSGRFSSFTCWTGGLVRWPSKDGVVCFCFLIGHNKDPHGAQTPVTNRQSAKGRGINEWTSGLAVGVVPSCKKKNQHHHTQCFVPSLGCGTCKPPLQHLEVEDDGRVPGLSPWSSTDTAYGSATSAPSAMLLRFHLLLFHHHSPPPSLSLSPIVSHCHQPLSRNSDSGHPPPPQKHAVA